MTEDRAADAVEAVHGISAGTGETGPAIPAARAFLTAREFAEATLSAEQVRMTGLRRQPDGGWTVDLHVFAPNPNLTAGSGRVARSVLDEMQVRIELDAKGMVTAVTGMDEA